MSRCVKNSQNHTLLLCFSPIPGEGLKSKENFVPYFSLLFKPFPRDWRKRKQQSVVLKIFHAPWHIFCVWKNIRTTFWCIVVSQSRGDRSKTWENFMDSGSQSETYISWSCVLRYSPNPLKNPPLLEPSILHCHNFWTSFEWLSWNALHADKIAEAVFFLCIYNNNLREKLFSFEIFLYSECTIWRRRFQTPTSYVLGKEAFKLFESPAWIYQVFSLSTTVRT